MTGGSQSLLPFTLGRAERLLGLAAGRVDVRVRAQVEDRLEIFRSDGRGEVWPHGARWLGRQGATIFAVWKS